MAPRQALFPVPAQENEIREYLLYILPCRLQGALNTFGFNYVSAFKCCGVDKSDSWLTCRGEGHSSMPYFFLPRVFHIVSMRGFHHGSERFILDFREGSEPSARASLKSDPYPASHRLRETWRTQVLSHA